MSALRILIVDDEPLNLEIIGAYLADEPWEIELFDDSLAAWERIHTAGVHFDLILLDHMMPGLDGLEFLVRLKSDPRFHALPVVMQTAANAPEDIARGLNAGAYYYLTKPYEQAALISILRSALADVSTRLQLQDQLKALRASLALIDHAELTLHTVQQIPFIVTLISQAAAHPEAAAMGLSELLCNAVEHGNLGITYAEKSALKLSDSWDAEVARRMALPENACKSVKIQMWREGELLAVRISDQGRGFNWSEFLEISPERAFDPNGRGIALARKMSFTTLNYLGCGNQVEAYLPANRLTMD